MVRPVATASTLSSPITTIPLGVFSATIRKSMKADGLLIISIYFRVGGHYKRGDLEVARYFEAVIRGYSGLEQGVSEESVGRSMDALQRIFELAEPERRARGLRHTPREIGQQPETWRSTRALVAERASAIRELLARVGVTASGGATILLVGAGTSDYIGRCVAPLLRKTWRADVFAVPSTELLTAMDEFTASGRPSLWVSFSRSGDSSEGVAVLEAALDRFPNVHHLIVTCNSDGRMARDFEGRPTSFRSCSTTPSTIAASR